MLKVIPKLIQRAAAVAQSVDDPSKVLVWYNSSWFESRRGIRWQAKLLAAPKVAEKELCLGISSGKKLIN